MSNTHGAPPSFMLVRLQLCTLPKLYPTNSSSIAGQLVAEYPFIYLMSKFPLTKLVGITV